MCKVFRIFEYDQFWRIVEYLHYKSWLICTFLKKNDRNVCVLKICDTAHETCYLHIESWLYSKIQRSWSISRILAFWIEFIFQYLQMTVNKKNARFNFIFVTDVCRLWNVKIYIMFQTSSSMFDFAIDV